MVVITNVHAVEAIRIVTPEDLQAFFNDSIGRTVAGGIGSHIHKPNPLVLVAWHLIIIRSYCVVELATPDATFTCLMAFSMTYTIVAMLNS